MVAGISLIVTYFRIQEYVASPGEVPMHTRTKDVRWAFMRTVAGMTIAALLFGGAVAVRAAGFALDYEGARALGAATAGAASAADATTIFYNPAGLAYLPGSEYVAGGQLFLLHDRFGDSGSTIVGGAMPTPGGNGREAI